MNFRPKLSRKIRGGVGYGVVVTSASWQDTNTKQKKQNT